MTKPSKKRASGKPRKTPVPPAPAATTDVASEDVPALGIGAPVGELPEEAREIMRQNSEQLEQLAAASEQAAEERVPARASLSEPLAAAPLAPAGWAAFRDWLARLFH